MNNVLNTLVNYKVDNKQDRADRHSKLTKITLSNKLLTFTYISKEAYPVEYIAGSSYVKLNFHNRIICHCLKDTNPEKLIFLSSVNEGNKLQIAQYLSVYISCIIRSLHYEKQQQPFFRDQEQFITSSHETYKRIAEGKYY